MARTHFGPRGRGRGRTNTDGSGRIPGGRLPPTASNRKCKADASSSAPPPPPPPPPPVGVDQAEVLPIPPPPPVGVAQSDVGSSARPPPPPPPPQPSSPASEGHSEPETEELVLQREPPFAGGPKDLSLLRKYPEHVAPILWESYLESHPEYVDRGDLTLTTCGKKLSNLSCDDVPQVLEIVQRSTLYPLVSCSYSMMDKGLVSAFVERWHSETSSFHMPFGEMTVTLDDVSCLLHIPVIGRMFLLPVIDEAIALDACERLLGADREDLRAEFGKTRGCNLRFSWMSDHYAQAVSERRWEHAARIYLLHLVGVTLFANKSHIYGSVTYLTAFEDLNMVGTYAWGTMALAVLYDQLGSASHYKTRQLSGYTYLLQAWIYEHFPSSLFFRHSVPGYTEDRPRAARWRCGKQGTVPCRTRREHIDDMDAHAVIWTPYAGHRDHRPLHLVSQFSGYIRGPDATRPYLPERVLRQFGHVQTVPRPPPGPPPSADDIDAAFAAFTDAVIPLGLQVSFPAESSPDYMTWFLHHSHPLLIPDQMRDSVGVASMLRRLEGWLTQSLTAHDAPPAGGPSRAALQRALDYTRQRTTSNFVYQKG